MAYSRGIPAALVSVLGLLVVLSASASKETFTEDLYIAPLGAQNVLAQFSFEVAVDDFRVKNENEIVHANLLPLPILTLFGRMKKANLNINELRLRFTQGRYLPSLWGLPKGGPKSAGLSELSAPSGLEYWVEFDSKTSLSADDIDTEWAKLKQLVGGLFSINFGLHNKERLLSPEVLPRTHSSLIGKRGIVRYESHPRESACTENLTPWLKLLPCHSSAGLAALLAKSPSLYNTQYHSMDFKILKTADNKLLMTQILTLVFPPRDDNLNLATLFPSNSVSSCPLSSSSRVHFLAGADAATKMDISIDENSKKALISPSLFDESISVDLIKLAAPFPLSAKLPKQDSLAPSFTTPFLVNRYILGHGQQDGELVFNFANSLKSTANVSLLFSSPWPVRFFFHGLKATLIHENGVSSDVNYGYLDIISLHPSEDRAKPSQLELGFKLKSNEKLVLSLPFERNFLHFSEHPPDPHRGYDIGSTLVEVVHSDPSTQWPSPLVVYTSGHSIMLPTPDFSMMYNVITLTCTVVAMFYGQALNLMSRRLSDVYTKDGEFVSNRPLARLYRRLFNRGEEKTDEKKDGEPPVEPK